MAAKTYAAKVAALLKKPAAKRKPAPKRNAIKPARKTVAKKTAALRIGLYQDHPRDATGHVRTDFIGTAKTIAIAEKMVDVLNARARPGVHFHWKQF